MNGDREKREPLMDTDEIINKNLSTLGTLMINGIVETQFRTIRDYYPTWPIGVNSKMLYKPPSERKSKDVKHSQPEKAETENQNIPCKASKATKQKSRYKQNFGGDVVGNGRKLRSQSSSNSLKSQKSETKSKVTKVSQSNNTDSRQQHGKPVKYEDAAKVSVKKALQVKAVGEKSSKISNQKQQKKKTHSLTDTSSSSSDDEQDEKIKFFKSIDMKRVPANHTAPVEVKKPPVSNINLLKSSFDSKNFDEAMREYSKKRKEVISQPKVIPQIIPAPDTDPALKKKKVTKKMPSNDLPEAHLGGIFTIDNGWDKPIQKKEPPKMIPREQRKLPEIEKITDHPFFRDKLHPEDSISFEEEVQPLYKLKHKSLFDSEDESTNEEHSSETAVKPASENDNQMNSELNEKFPSNDHYEGDSDEEFQIHANDDLDDLMDDVDEEPKLTHKEIVSAPCLVTELEDTCLKISLKRRQSPEPPKEESPKKLNNILGVDIDTDNIIKRVFGGACPGFLNYQCNLDKCLRRHTLLPKETLHGNISNLSTEYLNKAQSVLVRFHRLFQQHVGAFAHVHGMRKDENAIIELIKCCESHPRLLSYYRQIFHGLSQTKNYPINDALGFLIKYHNSDYEPTRDVIVNLILEIPPVNIGKYYDYLSYVMSKQKLPIETFKRLVNYCNEFQNQLFPNLCLSYMMTYTSNDLAELGDHDISEFIKGHHRFVRNYNPKESEAKLLALAEKLKQTERTIINKNFLDQAKKQVESPYQVYAVSK